MWQVNTWCVICSRSHCQSMSKTKVLNWCLLTGQVVIWATFSFMLNLQLKQQTFNTYTWKNQQFECNWNSLMASNNKRSIIIEKKNTNHLTQSIFIILCDDNLVWWYTGLRRLFIQNMVGNYVCHLEGSESSNLYDVCNYKRTVM